jgi:hypothetical protein
MVTGLAQLGGKDPAALIPAGPAGFFNLVGLAEWTETGERYRAGGPVEQPWA